MYVWGSKKASKMTKGMDVFLHYKEKNKINSSLVWRKLIQRHTWS